MLMTISIGRYELLAMVWSRLQSRRWVHEEKMPYLEDFSRNSMVEQFGDCSVQGTVGAIVPDI
ncbi:hypothetical protein DY000_02023002 [Brassica cretica]|uniref:Uncharacterized protein n=1 Tax=Brassica cretica TaxID=69181 RepID=A0ABQ7EJ99_BRACR|nr:hypothetical protein DY000_02023002 [Brassica cretica]